MHARNLLLTVLGCLLALGISTPISAQDSNDPNALAEQLAALQIMNSTVGPMLAQANTRNQQMLSYIKEKNLESDWNAYNRSSSAPTPQELSFDEGYKVSLKRVKLEQPVTSTNASAADLSSNIAATKRMVQSEWADYHTAHKTSARLSAFLQSKSMMSDYESWSKTYSKQRASDYQKKIAEANANESAASQKVRAKFKAQQRYLMQHWDEEMHLKSLANSSGYIMERNKQSVVSDSHAYPYIPNQQSSQTHPWSSQGPSYNNGSWHGGYSDPYYDLWGFPRVRDAQGGDAAAYSRTQPPIFHPGALSDGGGHKAMEGSDPK